jgi:hypothetical protein
MKLGPKTRFQRGSWSRISVAGAAETVVLRGFVRFGIRGITC